MISNYSTAEQNTGFKWIDGKTVYKKTIDFGALPNSAVKRVAHNIQNLDRIIKVEMSVDNGNGQGFLILASNDNTSFNIYGNAQQISVATNSDRSTIRAYFTLYYTKSS